MAPVDRSSRKTAFHLTTTEKSTTAKAAGRGFGLLANSTTRSRIASTISLAWGNNLNPCRAHFHLTSDFTGHQAGKLNSEHGLLRHL